VKLQVVKNGRANRTMRLMVTIVVAALFCVFFSVSMSGQTDTGRILGTVTDQSGAFVAGAAVTVTDLQRGISRSLTTTQAGEYVAPDLSSGSYKVRVQAKGFKSSERADIQVVVATDAQVDFTMQTGDATETVVVTGLLPLVDASSSTMGGTLSNEEINELPLNGRNYENLLQLRPGVVRYPGGGFSTTSTNGLRAEDNAYIVDGLFNSEPFSGQSIINGAGIAGDSATILPVDAIQEFNLIENPPAEYGWKPGAMVNVALKSGTNTFHGTAYAFGRNTPMDARNYFNTVSSGVKNPRTLEQFGATVGGPVLKDKVFFFGGYEGQRYTVNSISSILTPATVTLNGDPANSVVDAIADVQAHGITPSTPSLKIGGCTLGPPISCDGSGFPTNPGTNPAGATTINFGLPNAVNSDNAIAKIDFQLNQKNSFNALYFFGNNNGTVDDSLELQTKWLTQIHTRAQVAGFSWTWIPNTRTVNEARFGFNTVYQPTFTNDHSSLASTYGLNTGITNPLYGGLPRININTFYSGAQQLGGFNWPKVQGPDDRYQFIDHVSYTVGNHALKFGGEFHRDSFTGGAYGGGRGRIKFGYGADAFPGASPLEDFIAGTPTSALQLVGDPTRNIHNFGIAGFAEDDWRATKKLTINMGLRWEMNTVIKDSKNLLGNFDPIKGLVQVGQGISAPYNGDHTQFAPRFGFAWDAEGNGRTVVRGGGAMIYETLNWESFLALNNSLGLSTIPTGAMGVGPGGSQGSGSIAVGTVAFPGSALNWNAGYNSGAATVFPTGTIDCGASPCSILGIVQDLRTPVVYSWNINVQHAFTPNLTLETAYVGSHGSKLVGIHDINQNVPSQDFNHDEQSGRPFNAKFPFLNQIYQMGNIYQSNYNGLQMTLNARDFHHLNFVAGYTFSHSLDNVGANWDFGAGSGIPQDSYNAKREYASSDYDIRNRFTFSPSYQIPGIKGFGEMLEGWQVNSIVSIYGAQPWGPMDTGNDFSHTGEGVDRWDFYGNPSDFKSGNMPTPYLAGAAATADPVCAAHARDMNTLGAGGCFKVKNSVMTPPAAGTFGLMGRNTFRDSGFVNWDFSLDKKWTWRDRFSAQFRSEFFNVLNHPNFANPFGGQNGYQHNDPSSPGPGGFGCGCATPDVAASNPVIGSGGSRAVQLGLKLQF